MDIAKIKEILDEDFEVLKKETYIKNAENSDNMLDIDCFSVLLSDYVSEKLNIKTLQAISPDQIKIATEMAKKPAVKFHRMGLQRFCFAPGAFGLAFNFENFLKWNDYNATFKEIHRILKNGGVLLLFALKENLNEEVKNRVLEACKVNDIEKIKSLETNNGFYFSFIKE